MSSVKIIEHDYDAVADAQPRGMKEPSSPASPIFIVGNVHSGTTLMQGIIGRHPSVFHGRGESRFFHHSISIRRRYPDLADPVTRDDFIAFVLRIVLAGYGTVRDAVEVGQIIDLAELGITLEDIESLRCRLFGVIDHDRAFIVIYDYLAEKAGARCWLEKTPTHLLFAARILAVAPEARFVELVRDPRAILASKQKRRAGQEWMIRDSRRFKGGFDPILDSLGWRSMIDAGDNVASAWPERILRVRYEDLTASPAATVQVVCRFLDLDYDPSLLDVAWVNSTTGGHQMRGIGTAATERWKTDLQPSAALVCQWLLRDRMTRLAYSPLVYSWTTWLGALKWVAMSIVELPQLVYRRWRIGGSLQVRNLFSLYASRLRYLVVRTRRGGRDARNLR